VDVAREGAVSRPKDLPLPSVATLVILRAAPAPVPALAPVATAPSSERAAVDDVVLEVLERARSTAGSARVNAQNLHHPGGGVAAEEPVGDLERGVPLRELPQLLRNVDIALGGAVARSEDLPLPLVVTVL